MPDCLRIGIDGPLDIALRLSGLAPPNLTGTPPASDVRPYARVLLELLGGGSTLSVHVSTTGPEGGASRPATRSTDREAA